ncbi:MAG: peptidoglycan DD-metalloendopeptidase family protein [Rhodoblastus sp.]
MSARTHFPSAKEPESHFFFTVSRGGRQKRFALRPGVLYGLVAGLPLLGAVYLGATAYLFFRDDMVAALMARQARQQYAYEDRLAAMRLQLDRVTSRQLLDQDSFEGKVQHLIAREAQLETRTAIVAALGDRVGLSAETTASIAPPAPKSAPRTAESGKRAPLATGGPETKANGFAPLPQPMDDLPFKPDRPRPDGFELRGQSAEPRQPMRSGALAPEPNRLLAQAADADISTSARIELLATSLDRIERQQVEALAMLAGPAQRKAEQLESVIAETGLSASRLKSPEGAKAAVGGPFVPAGLDDRGTPFERQLAKVQHAFVALDRIRRVLPFVPVRKPLSGPLDITSTFGYRSDPFLGRPALHSGMDMRAETGTPARATAGGTVVTAGWTGGYGNMVEIDHGNGLSTRYGHLSAISVSDGQVLKAGDVVGRVGSTGRSTGPHLHYEVRIDDQATDPARFVKAARLLSARD